MHRNNTIILRWLLAFPQAFFPCLMISRDTRCCSASKRDTASPIDGMLKGMKQGTALY